MAAERNHLMSFEEWELTRSQLLNYIGVYCNMLLDDDPLANPAATTLLFWQGDQQAVDTVGMFQVPNMTTDPPAGYTKEYSVTSEDGTVTKVSEKYQNGNITQKTAEVIESSNKNYDIEDDAKPVTTVTNYAYDKDGKRSISNTQETYFSGKTVDKQYKDNAPVSGKTTWPNGDYETYGINANGYTTQNEYYTKDGKKINSAPVRDKYGNTELDYWNNSHEIKTAADRAADTNSIISGKFNDPANKTTNIAQSKAEIESDNERKAQIVSAKFKQQIGLNLTEEESVLYYNSQRGENDPIHFSGGNKGAGGSFN